MYTPSRLEIEKNKEMKRLSKSISEKLHINEEIVGRLTYNLILDKLANKIGESLHFKDSNFNESCKNLLNEVDLNIEELLNKPQFLDLLYQDLVSQSYRKKFGQFFTPNYIAEFMASWINLDKPCQVLDPSVGTGIFLENIIGTTDSPFPELWGFDIDPVLLNTCQVRLTLNGISSDLLHLIQEDFIKMGNFFAEKVDAVICNPPYLNFHNFDRNGLVSPIEKRCGVRLSRLTNIYVLFFIQSLLLTKDKGKLAFITPSEFLYTGYGEELKTFLLKYTTLDSLVLIDFEFSVFNKALTTAVITLFRRGPPKSRHKVKFIRVYSWSNTGEMLRAVTEGTEDSQNCRIVEVYQDELNPKKKWLEYFVDIRNNHVLNKLVPLSQLAEIHRGIATGFNKFFALSKSELNEWKIEDRFVIPVVTNAYQVKGYDFTVDDWNRLVEKNEKVFLLYIFEEPSQNLKKYIRYGEQELGANQRYITKHRSPWYSMEKRKPPKILATVFHRKKMRFIFNNVNARNLAPFHCVYPKFNDAIKVKALLTYLNSDLCKDIQVIKRREYGGGLHKFEPKDLENIPVIDITQLGSEDINGLASMFDELCSSFRKGQDETLIRKKIDDLLKLIIAKNLSE